MNVTLSQLHPNNVFRIGSELVKVYKQDEETHSTIVKLCECLDWDMPRPSSPNRDEWKYGYKCFPKTRLCARLMNHDLAIRSFQAIPSEFFVPRTFRYERNQKWSSDLLEEERVVNLDMFPPHAWDRWREFEDSYIDVDGLLRDHSGWLANIRTATIPIYAQLRNDLELEQPCIDSMFLDFKQNLDKPTIDLQLNTFLS